MATIFISYSSKDQTFASQLAESLKNLGHKLWLDEWNIKVGESIPTKIQDGLTSADYLIVVLSSSSVKSGWMEREWQAKYWEEVKAEKIMVLPVLIENCEIPALLKPKKYVDFRGDYGSALVKLMAGISPTFTSSSEPEISQPRKEDSDVSDLLSKIQSRIIPLAQCFTEALKIAIKLKNKDLEKFCRIELSGWQGRKGTYKSKTTPLYRLTEAFVTPHRINLQYFGWSNTSSVFEYMREEKKYFFPWKLLISESVAELESKVINPQTGVMIFEKLHKDFKPDSKTPSAVINVYFRPSAYPQILESIRTELTKKLLKLLPSV